MQVSIHEAQPTDAEPLIAYIHHLLAEPGLYVPLAPHEFKFTVAEEQKILADYAASVNSVFLLAKAGAEIVGLINCKGGGRQATCHAVTLGLSVHRAWRGQGIGSALLARAIDWAKNTGVITRMELFVYARNQAAIRLYEKFGFEVEGRRRRAIYQNGAYLDDLLMALLL